jgi:hypothetical protein
MWSVSKIYTTSFWSIEAPVLSSSKAEPLRQSTHYSQVDQRPSTNSNFRHAVGAIQGRVLRV